MLENDNNILDYEDWNVSKFIENKYITKNDIADLITEVFEVPTPHTIICQLTLGDITEILISVEDNKKSENYYSLILNYNTMEFNININGYIIAGEITIN